MAPRLDDGLLPTRTANYPKQRNTRYALVLILTKLLKAFGLFLMYDLLKLIHLVPFLFIVKAGAAVVFIILQRPSCRGLHRSQILRIMRHAVVSTFLHLLWMFGLTLCGPLRTILIYEHSPVTIIAAASALFKSIGGPSKFRGAVFLILAFLGIILFDHDDYDDVEKGEAFHPEGHHNGIIKHTFNHFLARSGLSDHKGGVVLLAITLIATVLFHSQSKKLSVDLGGSKRLHSLSTFVSSVLLLPWALMIHSSNESPLTLYSGLLPFGIVTLSVFIIDYYVDSVAATKLDASHSARIGSMAIFIAAMAFSFLWSHPFMETISTLAEYKNLITEDHLLSGGVVFSFVLIFFATSILTGSSRSANRGSFIGIAANGVPLYSYAEDQIHKTTASTIAILKSGLKQIVEDVNSRRIFYFLLLNLSFTFVELIYGAWTNSLGLISDGFHMLFDCSALVVGLYASIMSRWKATRSYSYGYDRVETLSGFVNGLFLVVVSFFIIMAAITRLVHPPHINTDRLLMVSTLGLIVNLFGIFSFSHAHSHGGGGGSSHGHSHGGASHGHSHGGASHGHSHDGVESKNSNMRGVFLHVLADTLGSVGVIISTLLIQYFEWNVADPVCSLFIGVMIFLSVIPLLTDTANVLLLRLPAEMQSDIAHCLKQILAMDGVLSYRDQHFWRHSGGMVCGTLHIQLSPDGSEQHTVQQASALLKNIGVKNLTVQVEKESYYYHLAGLNNGLNSYGTTEWTGGMGGRANSSYTSLVRAV